MLDRCVNGSWSSKSITARITTQSLSQHRVQVWHIKDGSQQGHETFWRAAIQCADAVSDDRQDWRDVLEDGFCMTNVDGNAAQESLSASSAARLSWTMSRQDSRA